MALAITTARVTTIHPVITGVHLDTSITIILIGVTVTGGIIIGGTISEGRPRPSAMVGSKKSLLQ